MGLKCNPFRVLTEAEWTAVAVVPPSVQKVITHAVAPVQIIGEPGRGKTTTLLAVKSYFLEKNISVMYQYLPEGTHRFDKQRASAANVFLLDEAQRLTRRERQRLCRLASGMRLIFSSHEDLTAICAAHRLPLTTIRLSQMDTAHLTRILRKRLAYFSTNEQPAVAIGGDAVEFLHARFGDDLRAMERFLYEVFQVWVGHAPAEKVLTADFLQTIFKTYADGRVSPRSHTNFTNFCF